MNVEFYSVLILCQCTGGPLITEEDDGDFTLVGILSGGGIDCAQLDDPNYNWQNETGRWMRVGALDKWIQSVIFSETEPGKKDLD